MLARWKRLLGFLLACTLVAFVVLVSDERAPVVVPPPPVALPLAIVTMGDSTLSGEGAGSYEPGTNGENGNWCHRSRSAPVYELHMSPTITPINLACSGVQAAQVGTESNPDATDTQTHQLADYARRYRIMDIVVQVGANDDPNFGDVVNQCVSAWASRSPNGCSADLHAVWPERVEQMRPKVLSALRAVRAVMSRAGYQPNSYALVVQSYASPVAPDIQPQLQNLSGCPLLTGDVAWIRDTAVPQLSLALHQVADQAGARFLDLSRAGEGHGACSGTSEWFTRLTVDWQSLKDDNRAPHALQESFHANAEGQAEFGRCLGEFLTSQANTGQCVVDQRGNLVSVPDRTLVQQNLHP